MKRKTTAVKRRANDSDQEKFEPQQPAPERIFALCNAAADVDKLIALEKDILPADPIHRLMVEHTRREAQDRGLDQLTEKHRIDCKDLAEVILSSKSALPYSWNPNLTSKIAIWLVRRNKSDEPAQRDQPVDNWVHEHILKAAQKGDMKFFLHLGDQLRAWEKKLKDGTPLINLTNGRSNKTDQKSLFPKWKAILIDRWAPSILPRRTFTGQGPKCWPGLAYLSRNMRLKWLQEYLGDEATLAENLQKDSLREFIRSRGLYIPKPLIVKRLQRASR